MTDDRRKDLIEYLNNRNIWHGFCRVLDGEAVYVNTGTGSEFAIPDNDLEALAQAVYDLKEKKEAVGYATREYNDAFNKQDDIMQRLVDAPIAEMGRKLLYEKGESDVDKD